MTGNLLRQDLLAYRTRLGLLNPPSQLSLLRLALSHKMLPITLMRTSAWLSQRSVPFFPRLLQLFNFLCYGIEVRPRCTIGGGFFLPHTHGTVIGARSIGCDCTIFQGVTLGAARLDLADDSSLRPVLEDGVTVGSGAKILGAITIGARTFIGANAVVARDVPPDSLVVAGHAIVK